MPQLRDRRRRSTSLLPTWPTVRIRPPPGDAVARCAAISTGVERLDERGDLVGRQDGSAHQLDEVAPVLAVGAQRQPRGPAGRPAAGPGRARSSGSTSAASSARARYDACAPRPSDRARRAGREDVRSSQAVGAVADDGRSARRSCGLAPAAPVRRLESPFAVGHLRGGGHLGLASRPCRLTVFLTGASVPTSVSLSSPRMNASTRLNAMSSWIWCGGLFMK